ncbi:MAG: precorrin-6A/cobalt-precorrin-6A reductase, partial [Senegalia sp. (in: firmicutes)]
MILVLSGTEDGREIVEKLLKNNQTVLATTATEYGGKLFKIHPKLKVISERLDIDDMIALIKKYNIKTIVDATHPYAAEVSKNAIKA